MSHPKLSIRRRRRHEEQKSVANVSMLTTTRLRYYAILSAILMISVCCWWKEVARGTSEEDFLLSSAFDTHQYAGWQAPFRSYPCMPRKVHISQRSNVKISKSPHHHVSMTVSFVLDKDSCSSVKPYIVYGRGISQEGQSTDAERVNFTYASPVTRDIFESDWIYHIELKELQAGMETYWYRIVVVEQSTEDDDVTALPSSLQGKRIRLPSTIENNDPVRWFFLRGRRHILGETPNYWLRTPPLPGSPTSLAFVGDIGQTENSTKTMHHIYNAATGLSEHPVSALMIAGDLSYANGDPHRWERWLDIMEPLLRSIPLQSIPGNHEIECDDNTSMTFEQYEHYFRNPNRIQDADIIPINPFYRRTMFSCVTPSQFRGHYNFGNAFYGFSHGLVHIIALNSYTATDPSSPQYQWLEQELQSVDRRVTPWLLIMFHCPLHTTFLGHNDEANPARMLKNMEPLFVQYHTNIIINGHDHAYMRTKPMIGTSNTIEEKNGIVHFTLGAGGNQEGHPHGYVHDEPEEWVAKRDREEFGFGHLFVANATHAQFNWVRDGTTEDGVQDSVWIENHWATSEEEERSSSLASYSSS